MADAKRQAPVVLVYLHWGEEGHICPTAAQTDLARRLATAGATAVVGTHAHTMLGSGMLGGTFYPEGRASALEIQDGRFVAIYEDGREQLPVRLITRNSNSSDLR